MTTTDRELVLGFCPSAAVQSRVHPRTLATEYQVSYEPIPGDRIERIGWVPTESKAWRAACIRMGLRIKRL